MNYVFFLVWLLDLVQWRRDDGVDRRSTGALLALHTFYLVIILNAAVIFAASGPIAVTLAVGLAGGLTQAELASWVFGIFLSAGLATIVMSLVYRQPLGFAWSIPGTVLLGPSLQHLSFAEVVGAFFGCGVLVLALGMTGLVRRVMTAIPMPIIMAMVAAVFLRFGTDIVDASRDNPVVAVPMVVLASCMGLVP